MAHGDPRDNSLGIRFVTDPAMSPDQIMLVNVDAAHRMCPGCKEIVPLRSFVDVGSNVMRDICAKCREQDGRELYVKKKFTDLVDLES